MNDEKFLNEYEAYVIFSTLRLYFLNKYDINYGFMWKTFTVEKFEKSNAKRNCIRLVEKYQRKRNLVFAIAANLVRSPTLYFQDILDDEAYDNYLSFKGWSSQPVRITTEETNKILTKHNVTSLDRSLAVSSVIGGKLHPASYTLLNKASLITDDTNDDYLQTTLRNRLQKFSKFVIVSKVSIDNLTYSIQNPILT